MLFGLLANFYYSKKSLFDKRCISFNEYIKNKKGKIKMRKILLLLILFLFLILTGCQLYSFTMEKEFEESYYSGMIIDFENI